LNRLFVETSLVCGYEAWFVLIAIVVWIQQERPDWKRGFFKSHLKILTIGTDLNLEERRYAE